MDNSDYVPSVKLRWLAVGLMLLGLAPLTGCRICPDCDDIAYPAFGGSWQRTKRDSGRVGSVFDPAGGKTSELAPRDSPTATDELERIRQQGRVPRVPDEDEMRGDDTDIPEDDPRNDLRQRGLDDLEDDGGGGLRDRDLRDIEVKVINEGEMPPLLR